MRLAAIRTLLRKEVLDLIRDRRTLISLVLAPMLVGPVIMSAMNYYMQRSQQQAQVERFKVGVREDITVAGLRESLVRAGLDVTQASSPRQAVEDKRVTFGVEVTGDVQRPTVRFFSDNSDMKASMARGRVAEVLERISRERVRAELAKRNVPETVLDPFNRESVNVAPARKMTGSAVGRIVGFLMLIFLFNGAMYAAVDMTAGEKERRTLEILLASAASRSEIVVAKVLTALLTSFGTTVLSLISYALALSRMESRRGSVLSQLVFPTDPATILLLMLLILPIAVVAAAISVAASTPAKSTREAMSYLTPGLFIVMFLGMVTFIPDLESSMAVALVPFANFSQMLREVLTGEWSWTHYGLTVASNLVYASLASAVAIRNFTKEKILFRS